MKRSLGILLLPSLAGASPSEAQSINPNSPEYSLDVWRVTAQPRRMRTDPIIAVPLAEQIKVDGSRTQLRGILLAKDIAPNVTIGLGLLDMKPRKSRLSPNPGLDGSSRGSRKAAVRLSVKF